MNYEPFLPFSPLQDPSNLDVSIPRNRIRHKLLPQLEEEYNPSIRQTLLRETEVFSSLGELLDTLIEEVKREDVSVTDRGLEINIEALCRRPIAIQRHLILRGLRRLGLEPRFELVEDIRRLLLEAEGNPCLDLGSGLTARRSYESLILGPRPREFSFQGITIPGEGVFPLYQHGIRIKLELLPRGNMDPKRDSMGPEIAWLDADRLAFPLEARGTRPGDRFHPLGSPGQRKIQDFLVDLKIPREERGRVIVLESAGEIAWVLGLRIDERFKVGEETSCVAMISIDEISE